jgi:hypothetical protein
MMQTPTIFEPVIIKNVCSKTYLDMFMHFIPSVDYFTPEMHFCGISMKDKTTKVNLHTDNWDENKLKILGVLNSDWDNKKDGGGFIYNNMSYPLQPMNFLIFDSRQTHSNDIILSDKERIAIDFTVTKL